MQKTTIGSAVKANSVSEQIFSIDDDDDDGEEIFVGFSVRFCCRFRISVSHSTTYFYFFAWLHLPFQFHFIALNKSKLTVIEWDGSLIILYSHCDGKCFSLSIFLFSKIVLLFSQIVEMSNIFVSFYSIFRFITSLNNSTVSVLIYWIFTRDKLKLINTDAKSVKQN